MKKKSKLEGMSDLEDEYMSLRVIGDLESMFKLKIQLNNDLNSIDAHIKVRIEYLRQQQLIAKLQREQLKEHLQGINSPTSSNNRSSMSRGGSTEPISGPATAYVRSSSAAPLAGGGGSGNGMPNVTAAAPRPISNRNSGSNNNNNANDDTLINCILEMKPMPMSGSNNNVTAQPIRTPANNNNNTMQTFKGRQVKKTLKKT